MSTARICFLLCIVYVLAGFTVRAPFAIGRVHLTPDSILYLNIAGNVASGRGYVSSIKLHHVDDANVVHSAWRDCPPLYPLLSGAVMRLGGGLTALTMVNALLVSLASGLVFLIGERLFDRRTGLLAGVAAALAPNLFRAGMTPMSDALALALGLSALALVVRGKPSSLTCAVAGGLSGLAALTRHPYAVLAAALIVYCFRKSRRSGLACAAGVAPAAVLVALTSPSVQSLHFCVASFSSAMWDYGTGIVPLYFAHHPAFVATAFLKNLWFYSADLFFGLRGFFLLSVGLLMWVARAKQKQIGPAHRLMLIVAALNLVLYSAVWSVPPVKGSRFLLLSYCLTLPFCAAGLIRVWDRWGLLGKRATAAICAVTAVVYVWGCATAYVSTSDCKRLPAAAITLVESSLGPNAVVASNNPWEVSYSTGLPTVLLPRNLDEDELARFVRRYRVQGIVLLESRGRSITARSVRYRYTCRGTCSAIAVYTTARTHRTGS